MMSSTNDEDPFLQVQRDVLAQLSAARPLFASYLRIRSLSSTSSSGPSPELASARADLESALSALSDDLADLVAAVRAVEAAGEEATARFGIAPHEVSRRRRLVQEVGDEVEEMREELARQVDVAAVGAAGGKKAGASSDLPDPSSFAVPDGRDDDVSNEDYAAEFERQQQLQMMREQDQHLDGVFQTVGNLRRQADDMGRELEEQVEMLDGVDRLADRVGGRLQTGVEKLRHVMRRNEDRFSSWCIGLLIVVLIVLLVLLLVL